MRSESQAATASQKQAEEKNLKLDLGSPISTDDSLDPAGDSGQENVSDFSVQRIVSSCLEIPWLLPKPWSWLERGDGIGSTAPPSARGGRSLTHMHTLGFRPGMTAALCIP